MRSIPLLTVLFLAWPSLVPSSEAERPEIRKLGTLDLDMVEATPVVIRGRRGLPHCADPRRGRATPEPPPARVRR